MDGSSPDSLLVCPGGSEAPIDTAGQTEATLNTAREPETSLNTAREPEPTQNAAREPEPTQNTAREPEPTQNTAREPEPTQNTAREPEPTQNAASEPEPTLNTASQPKATVITVCQHALVSVSPPENSSPLPSSSTPLPPPLLGHTCSSSGSSVDSNNSSCCINSSSCSSDCDNSVNHLAPRWRHCCETAVGGTEERYENGTSLTSDDSDRNGVNNGSLEKPLGAQALGACCKTGEHEKTKPNTANHSRSDQLFELMKGERSAANQMRVLARLNSHSQSDERTLREILDYVGQVFSEVFPGCQVYCFGSSVNGLGSRDSDLDIHLELESQYFADGSMLDKTCKLEMIVSAMAEHDKVFTHLVSVPQARVPVVKFLHCPSGIPCDISFKNMMGIYNSEFIRCCCDYDPRFQPLYSTIKYFFKEQGLVGGGGGEKLTSYTLTLMLIYYLQQLERPILPPVAEILIFGDEDGDEDEQEEEEEEVEEEEGPASGRRHINGWNFNFTFQHLARLNLENTMDLDSLITGFFEYYATFYYEFIICPFFGTEMTRNSIRCKTFSGMDQWLVQSYPKAVKLFRWCFDDTVVYKRSLQIQSPMCVQDPFELNHNVSRNVDSQTLRRVKKVCCEAVRVCSLFQHPKPSLRTNLLDLLKLKIEEREYDEYTDRQLIPVRSGVWPRLSSPPGSSGWEGEGGYSRLTTPSNRLVCTFCRQDKDNQDTYNGFEFLREHFFQKHKEEIKRVNYSPVHVLETVRVKTRVRHTIVTLHNITCSQQNSTTSQEELRWKHYTNTNNISFLQNNNICNSPNRFTQNDSPPQNYAAKVLAQEPSHSHTHGRVVNHSSPLEKNPPVHLRPSETPLSPAAKPRPGPPDTRQNGSPALFSSKLSPGTADKNG